MMNFVEINVRQDGIKISGNANYAVLPEGSSLTLFGLK